MANALCSIDAPWCEAAAAEFTRQTGIKVNQAHKGTGEIGAQLRAEAQNPKTDIQTGCGRWVLLHQSVRRLR